MTDHYWCALSKPAVQCCSVHLSEYIILRCGMDKIRVDSTWQHVCIQKFFMCASYIAAMLDSMEQVEHYLMSAMKIV